MKIVTTNGCFDLLHIGHIRLLEFAKQQGDELWVLVNSDESVRMLKGPSRPIQDAFTRVNQILALRCVDRVMMFNDLSAVLKNIQPQVHVKGSDWEHKNTVEDGLLASWGGEIRYFSRIPGYSTTELISKIRSTP